jgi:hypothetical protein
MPTATDSLVVTQQVDDPPRFDSRDYTLRRSPPLVKTVYQWGSGTLPHVFSISVELDEQGPVLSSGPASTTTTTPASSADGNEERVRPARQLVRTDVLVTDNSHNDEFRSQSTAISEYDDRDRTRRVLHTEVDPSIRFSSRRHVHVSGRRHSPNDDETTAPTAH